MSHLIKNIDKLKNSLSDDITIVIATKYASLDDIKVISDSFPDLAFGENRFQQGEEKQSAFPNLQNPWHFIGHLQRNKVKKVIQNYDLIHSIDSERLLIEVNQASQKNNQKTRVLLQVNPLEEDSKFGFNETSIYEAANMSKTLDNVHVMGLMSMAPFDSDTTIIKKTFKKTRTIYDKLKNDGLQMEQLSMGMSNDYKIAIDEGANMIRVGSIIFA